MPSSSSCAQPLEESEREEFEEEEESDVAQDSPVSISSDDEHVDPLSPWQRRVVLQKIKKLKIMQRTERNVICWGLLSLRSEHRWLPGNLILVRASWDEDLQVPVTLAWLGQGRNRVTYDLQPDKVLKLTSRMTHGPERHFSNAFPRLCAQVTWEGPLTLQWDNARERGTIVLNGLVIKKCHLIKPCLIQNQGTVKAFEFLAYTNLAVEDISQEYPTISFIDLQDWSEGSSSSMKTPNCGSWPSKWGQPIWQCLSALPAKAPIEAMLKPCYSIALPTMITSGGMAF